MATQNVTVSVDDAILDQARKLAAAGGVSLSAYTARAVREMVRRDQARAYAEWSATPEVADELAAIRADRAEARARRRHDDAA